MSTPSQSRKIARILVADDEKSIRLGCEKVLTSMGHEITLTEDGHQALRKFEETGFDLVILDLMMPEIDGLTLIPKLLEKDPSVVVIMITGYASFETAVKAIHLGAYDYVPKPFTPDELKIVVKRATEKRFLTLNNLELKAERERTLANLAFEQTQTRAIIDSMGEAVMVINRKQELVLHNPAARHLLRDDGPLTGQPISRVTHLESLPKTLEEGLAKLGGNVQGISREIEDPGRKKTFLLNMAGVYHDDSAKEDLLGTVLVFSDITPMKNLERAKSRFVSMVSHELKAPMAAIEGYLELILREPETKPELFRAKLERCKDRAGMLQRLIRELLDLTGIEMGKMTRNLELFDPHPILSELCELFRPEALKRGITVSIPENKDQYKIKGDRNEVNQIFTNFLSNAVKYNKQNGTVQVNIERSGDILKITVEDTGLGIPENQMKFIGEEFFRVKTPETAKISGTGLGLAITKRLLELNHARLEISSTPGQGSLFTIRWPLATPG